MSIDPRTPKSDLSAQGALPITEFVTKAPNATYTINELAAEPTPLVKLCREGRTAGAKTCVEIHEEMTKVFAMMQKQGFFCSLPFDPSNTAIECERIEKMLERTR